VTELRLDQTRGPKWDLALELLDRGQGDAIVLHGDIELRRFATGPNGDSRIQVAVRYPVIPVDREEAEARFRDAHTAVTLLLSRDGRLRERFRRYGSVWRLAVSEGHLAATLAQLDESGQIVWDTQKD
jgi:hypothetical protein